MQDQSYPAYQDVGAVQWSPVATLQALWNQ